MTLPDKPAMVVSSFVAGVRGVRRRPGLVLLLYVVNLVPAFLLGLPLLAALHSEVGPTGFGPELARQFDLVLWAELAATLGAALDAVLAQLLWTAPLYLLWMTAARVGLTHALRGDQIRSFWQGVGRYTARGVLLAVLFLVPLVVLAVGTVVAALFLGMLWQGEAGTFWIGLVITPALLIGGAAVLDLMHDYARIALVVDEQPVWRAAGTGIRWPFRHGQAGRLYLAWFVPAALLLALPALLDARAVAATTGAVWGLFLVQQGVLLLRAAVTVGWIGSEVALYETVWFFEAPLIAEGAAVPPPPPAA